MKQRIVLAFSGGPASAAAIPWLAARHDAEVIAMTLDLGQSSGLEDVRHRALSAGAARAHVLDVRDEFARGYLLPALRAGTTDGSLPMAAPLVRALVAKKLLEVAAIEGARSVAHGCTVSDADDVTFEARVHALDPDIAVIGPAWLDPASEAAPRAGANLWGRWTTGQPSYTLTKPPASAPDSPARVDISFDHGIPVAVNGVTMDVVELIESLTTIAGQHGVGRLEYAEAPASVVLYTAYRELGSKPGGDVHLELFKGQLR